MTLRHRNPLATLLALALSVSLIAAGCGRSDDGATSETTSGDTPSADEPTGFINPDEDCEDYQGTAGIDGTTIKIGTIRPTSGPAAIYDTVATGMEKYFEAANARGGIAAGDGKTYMIELVKGDDGYDANRTPGEATRLVDNEGVFALVGDIGTETSQAIQEDMNTRCVPMLAVATGSPSWGDNNQYPWTISGLPSYATEAHRIVEYLKETKPDAKIALLYQNDDFGESYKKAFEAGIEGTDMSVVASESYVPAPGATPEGQVVKLATSGADVFFVGVAGTACPTALSKVPSDWTPQTWVSIVCTSKLAMSIAQDRAEGLYSAQATLDPASAEDQANPKVQTFFEEGAKVGLTQDEMEGGIISVGWGFGAAFEMALQQATTVDRAGVMNALWSLEDAPSFGLVRDEVTINTDGADDAWVIEGLRIAKRTNGEWVEEAPTVNYEGESNSFTG